MAGRSDFQHAIPLILRSTGTAKQGEARMPAFFNIPDTAMASAFLNALVRLVGAHHSKTKVTLPTGIVEVGELELVLRALRLIDDRRGPQ
jgi:hypothetical protein